MKDFAHTKGGTPMRICPCMPRVLCGKSSQNAKRSCARLSSLLNKWKNVPAARMGGTEMIPLLPALKDIADNPQYAGLRPWAILAMRNINAALSVR